MKNSSEYVEMDEYIRRIKSNEEYIEIYGDGQTEQKDISSNKDYIRKLEN